MGVLVHTPVPRLSAAWEESRARDWTSQYRLLFMGNLSPSLGIGPWPGRHQRLVKWEPRTVKGCSPARSPPLSLAVAVASWSMARLQLYWYWYWSGTGSRKSWRIQLKTMIDVACAEYAYACRRGLSLYAVCPVLHMCSRTNEAGGTRTSLGG